MAHKVIKKFRDKTDNNKLYRKGDSYTHNDEKRIAFLVDKGYLEKPKAEKKAPAKKKGE